ncbi:glycosyltransferase family 4 protein [Nocardia alni]|uniref:glycosyltransferase family 4 protein n=1 Tax=Nocardia alni TaxID=2815723 RepID=UPI001C246F12|nr:glycosyltransferase family 4 protein [Nocardia alni]
MTGSEWFSTLPGGLNRYFTDLHAALSVLPDIDVGAAAFGDPPPGARSWGPTGATTLHRVRTAFLDRRELRRNTVLDRHFCLYGPLATSRYRHLPLVVHFHGPWAAESRLAGERDRSVRAKYLLERLRYARADRFIVLSEHFRDLLIADYHVHADRISVVPPGVELPPETTTHTVTHHDSTRTVLCVRRLERRMGIDVLLRCWPSVVDEHPEARLVIVGTGTAETLLREQARGLDSVTFTGYVEDTRLADLYARAELTVVPSLALEGFGLVALASLAAGRAPIVTDCGGLPDSVRGLDDSLIVPAGDADALAARITSALHGARPTAPQCRTHAERFSWDTAARRHVALYAELAGS